MEALKAKFASLQPRERKLLAMMGGVFLFLAIFVVFITVKRSFDEKQSEIDTYREALYYLEDNQHTYHANKGEAESLRQRLVAGNDFGVTAFLSKTATDLGFEVSVDPKSWAPASTTDASGAEALEVQVTIRNVERNQLLDYLWTIDQSDAPLYVQRLQLNRSRATGSEGGSETPLAASVTVVAYRLDESGGGFDDE